MLLWKRAATFWCIYCFVIFDFYQFNDLLCNKSERWNKSDFHTCFCCCSPRSIQDFHVTVDLFTRVNIKPPDNFRVQPGEGVFPWVFWPLPLHSQHYTLHNYHQIGPKILVEVVDKKKHQFEQQNQDGKMLLVFLTFASSDCISCGWLGLKGNRESTRAFLAPFSMPQIMTCWNRKLNWHTHSHTHKPHKRSHTKITLAHGEMKAGGVNVTWFEIFRSDSRVSSKLHFVINLHSSSLLALGNQLHDWTPPTPPTPRQSQ